MRYQIKLTEMDPHGCNDAVIVNKDTLEIVDVIPEATFGYPSNTRIKPDLALTFESIDDVSALEDPELLEAGVTQGLYSVRLKDVLKRIAVSPVSDGSETIKALKQYFRFK